MKRVKGFFLSVVSVGQLSICMSFLWSAQAENLNQSSCIALPVYVSEFLV